MDADVEMADLLPAAIEAFQMSADADEPPFDPPEFEVEADERDPVDDAVARPEQTAPPASMVAEEEEADFVNDNAPSVVQPDAVPAEAFDEEPPPFDPPDDEAESVVFSTVVLPPLNEMAPAASGELLLVKPSAPRLPERNLVRSDETEAKSPCQPAPPISIHVFWDRVEMNAVFGEFELDVRMARASGGAARGGLDAAIARYSSEPSPDLLIVDSTLGVSALLVGLDRLAEVLDARTKLIIIGALNDIGLLRELAMRGVSEYFVPPVTADVLAQTTCALFASANTSRVIAVMGARGGVGASTLAQNIAWSIAERQQMGAALIDLDVAFGTAAFHLQLGGEAGSLSAALAAPEDAAALERSVMRASPRFQVLPAPSNVAPGTDIEIEALQALIANARRLSPFVVLDLPHHWAGWMKQALALADDVLLVSAPDLASLAATKNLLEQMKGLRAGANEPLLALSMVGVPKRPEIRLKDFAEAAGVTPIASIAFDPQSFGEACGAGMMLCEAAPKSPAAVMMDAIATALTGRDIITRKTPTRERFAAPVAKAVEAPAPEVETITPMAAEAAAASVVRTHPVPVLAQEEAPLELVTRAPPLPQARPARRACSRAAARHRDVERRQRPGRARPGLVRTAIALVTLIALGAWYAQNGAEAVSTSAPVAAAPIDLDQRYAVAEQMLSEGATDEAVALLQRVASAGLPAAQYRLAKLYEAGEVLSADIERARAWTERAARGGHARAMHDLGVYYARGEGGARDDAAAFRWFRQAADFGVADSQFNLGVMYEQGRGVTANADEALFWFTLAAENGDAVAAERVSVMETQLTPMQVEQAQARAGAFVQ